MLMRYWVMAALIVVIVFGLLVGVLVRRAGSQCPDGKGLYPECLFVVTVAGDQIVVRTPEPSESRIALGDLREVVVETNDSGPAGADVWWRLYGAEPAPRCSYPGGATGETRVLEHLQALPGFDNDALIEAMGSTSNRRFTVYRR
jgi:hypothetical protein